MAYISFQPNNYFETKLYDGSGSTQSITGLDFQPDWVWIKRRSSARGHNIFDAVRGATYGIYPDETGAESAGATQLTSFNSDGFTLGADDRVSGSGHTYVSWNLKANGAGSSNTDGSITSTVSASTTSGFSICKFVGTGSNATVGHGLGVAPKMIILKSLGTNNWSVYHGSLGGTKALFMDLTGAVATHIDYWNNTDPTSSVFSIGTSSNMNHSGTEMIAYCFAQKSGFSSMGSYTGNGNADGTFIYTGFKPAWVIIRATDVGGGIDWYVFDSKRPGYNLTNLELQPNNTGEESSDIDLDLLSNGFKPRGTQTGHNGSGNNYTYMAFAEEPLVSSNGVPATAR
tara:strand:+ start:181 stop:1209 length:1029 start_codon:yes stop_codon:yes gene_type:complete